ncbi:MAG: response regulator [Oscillospiraceae bacterium]|nr:response regulator [Oscillospiraceae bacterium]
MIKVLLAEDEPPTLRRVAGMVEQLDPAFKIAATALNGRQALDAFSQAPCDVVISDIRMPVMDGLQLMERVRAIDPTCMIVVLSGYSDFQYVSHALRMGSVDYLLKPVSAQSLRETLARLKERFLARERTHIRNRLSMHLNRSAPAPFAPLQADQSDARCLCLFCAGSLPPDDAADSVELYPGAAFWNTVSLEAIARNALTSKPAANRAGEEATIPFTWEFMGDTAAERILIFQLDGGYAPDARTQNELAVEWAARLHAALIELAGNDERSSPPIHCACLDRAIPLPQTNRMLKKLRQALADQIQVGRSVFIRLDGGAATDAAKQCADAQYDLNLLAQALANSMSRGGTTASDPFLRDLFDRIEREAWPQRRILRLFMNAADHRRPDDSGGAAESEARQSRAVLAEAICSAISFRDLRETLDGLASPNANAEPDSGERRAGAVSDAVKLYLNEHYAEHITHKTLAQVFGYVPSYISALFRRRYGVSPSEYLVERRIEVAKEILLNQNDILIREVAELVGFKNQHHFSRTFKKRTGVWPTGYPADYSSKDHPFKKESGASE